MRLRTPKRQRAYEMYALTCLPILGSIGEKLGHVEAALSFQNRVTPELDHPGQILLCMATLTYNTPCRS